MKFVANVLLLGFLAVLLTTIVASAQQLSTQTGGTGVSGSTFTPTVTAGAVTLTAGCLMDKCVDTNVVANGSNTSTLAITTAASTAMHSPSYQDIEIDSDGSHAPSSVTLTGGAGVGVDFGNIGNTLASCGTLTSTNKIHLHALWYSGDYTVLTCTTDPGPATLAVSLGGTAATKGGAWTSPVTGTVAGAATFTTNELSLICFAPVSSPVTINKFSLFLGTHDTTSTDYYDVCVYGMSAGAMLNSGAPLASLSTGTGAANGVNLSGTSGSMQNLTPGTSVPVTVLPGQNICVGYTGTTTTAQLGFCSGSANTGILLKNTSYASTTNGVCPTISAPTLAPVSSATDLGITLY